MATEFDIQEQLFSRFLLLNEYSGKQYIDFDSDKKKQNVHFPNEPFSIPLGKKKSWFDLTFRSNAPNRISIGSKSLSRYTGIMYIDIYTPSERGENEAKEKFKSISRLFGAESENFGDVEINRVYISTKGNDGGYYRLQCAVDWTADIETEY